MKIEIETMVAAPPQIVYGTLTDLAHWPEFLRGVARVEVLTPGTLAIGTRFRETRTMLGRSTTEEMTVAALDPPHRFELTAENHGTRYRVVQNVSAVAGGSQLRLSFEGTPVTLAAKLGAVLALLFKGAVTRQLQSDLADVKAEAERRAQR